MRRGDDGELDQSWGCEGEVRELGVAAGSGPRPGAGHYDGALDGGWIRR